MAKLRSWRNPLKGATPVPGPIMITGVCGLVGSLKADRRTNTGTLGLFSGSFCDSQLVATPFTVRPVKVSYCTKTAVTWMRVG
jgi:hypothetical protein